MKTPDNVLVVFDGTSAYIIPCDECTNELEILGRFNDINIASDFCDEQNHYINFNK